MRGRRVFGLECEYGLLVTGVASLASEHAGTRFFQPRPVGWTPAGGRFYLDVGGHPEHATPECLDPFSLVLHEAAGARVVEAQRRVAETRLRAEWEDASMFCFRNNFDSLERASFGTHENFLSRRSLSWERLQPVLVAHLVSRQIMSGAGAWNPSGEFRLAARSSALTSLASARTTNDKPLLNLRDEPHAKRSDWRRLHMTSGDTLQNQVQQVLRAAVFHLVLRAVEESGGRWRDWGIGEREVLGVVRAVSEDPSARKVVSVWERRWRALDVQRDLLERAARILDRHGELADPVPEATVAVAVAALDAAGMDTSLLEGGRWERWALGEWARTLDLIEAGDVDALAPTVDWAAKRVLVDRACARLGCGPADERIGRLLLSYVDTDPSRSAFDRLAARGVVLRLFPETLVRSAMMSPPPGRAASRRMLVEEFQRRVGSLPVQDWALISTVGRSVHLADPFGDQAVTATDVEWLVEGGPPASSPYFPYATEMEELEELWASTLMASAGGDFDGFYD